MSKFRKYIAGLSILGISIQSIFGYTALIATTGVVVEQILAPVKNITAAGTATFVGRSCDDFISYHTNVNYYVETNADAGIIKNDQRIVSGILTNTGAFQ